MYIVNIGRLCGILPADCHRLRGSEMASGMSSIENAWLHIEGAKIVDFGKMPTLEAAGGEVVDASTGIEFTKFIWKRMQASSFTMNGQTAHL